MQNYESNEAENFPSPPNKSYLLSSDSLPVSPNNPPWNSLTAVGVWVASIAFIIIVPGIFLISYLKTQAIDLTDQTALTEFAKTDPTAVLLQIVAVIPAHLLTLLVAWLVVTRLRKFSFRETLGWRWNGFNIWTCLAILGGFFALSGIASYLFPDQNNDFLRMLKTSRTVVYVVAFLATFTAPLVEEVVYRGVLYSALQKTFKTPIRVLLSKYRFFQKLRSFAVKLNLYQAIKKLILPIENLLFNYPIQAAVLFVTAIFALVHVPQYWGSPATIVLLLILSLVLTLVRWRTENLLPCIALHTVFNGTQSVLLIFQPYIESYIESHQPQAAALIHFFK